MSSKYGNRIRTGPFQEPTFDNRNLAVSAESRVTHAMSDIRKHACDVRYIKYTCDVRFKKHTYDVQYSKKHT